jgi:hypothetical protein
MAYCALDWHGGPECYWDGTGSCTDATTTTTDAARTMTKTVTCSAATDVSLCD